MDSDDEAALAAMSEAFDIFADEVGAILKDVKLDRPVLAAAHVAILGAADRLIQTDNAALLTKLELASQDWYEIHES